MTLKYKVNQYIFFSQGGVGIGNQTVSLQKQFFNHLFSFTLQIERLRSHHIAELELYFSDALGQAHSLINWNLSQKPHKIVRIKSITLGIESFKISYLIHYNEL